MPQRELEASQRRWILRLHAKGGGRRNRGVPGAFRGRIICRHCTRGGFIWSIRGQGRPETFGWGKAYTAHFGKLPTALARDEGARAASTPMPMSRRWNRGQFTPPAGHRLTELLDFAYLDTSHACLQQRWPSFARSTRRIGLHGVIHGDDWQPDPRHQHPWRVSRRSGFTRAQPWQHRGRRARWSMGAAPAKGQGGG